MNIVRKNSSPRMSQSVEVNGFLFMAGQVADNLDGDIVSQTQCVLSKIDGLLDDSGFDKSRLVDVKIYIANGDDFERMNAVYEAWIGNENQPVRLCLVSDFPNSMYLIEVQAMAAVN
ncbi:RidA family protein [Pontibacterium granulatum]|uniref:RidA family protein n=1 Tax=Pontibacterium granulatum TaxID=2036029 RepID=UPI00249CE112|nr:RidA family protein [Pontibacterium granulatum]MDI3326315.1 RidA family protein [Pontibacterium granulatum]